MKKAYRKLSNKLIWLIIMTLIIYIVTIIYSIISLSNQGQTTSFPWWSGLAIYSIYFIPVLIIELLIYLIVIKEAEKLIKESQNRES